MTDDKGKNSNKPSKENTKKPLHEEVNRNAILHDESIKRNKKDSDKKSD